ncbi:MAG: trypsin-like peptidase domain-containing protein [Hydrogenophaga sp.]|uniref:S1C family serine protease n=2 Tax=Hydrogenophaga sp. TaxID=1904254 RepID=UPI0025C64778|nr:trypsin-like peptidase domain-containing protein [Hydrogenophaga sp.]MDO8887171.1 trypsin-like peptidase domain-containing protein [Hydrogenophaga sp.]MDO9131838.1 trypsin-like peptidase domain-containing protein [Hydrogenophaga sp.]MDO9506288.1 trypsin-like peptidase domain-containing protein [Hydrogenophaga sp.]MDP2073241.1 trypsin-like peptidase domain-containing protein [Hydrogenophaga sp.]MDP2252448.1 trypsin-like peptidase domain-containing protein [Hydrogenophaga sp.]
MRKPALYSPSSRAGTSQPDAGARPGESASANAVEAPKRGGRWSRFRAGSSRAAATPRVMWSAMALLAALLAASVWQGGVNGTKALTQKDIDAAVLRTLTTQNLPSRAARAAEKIRPAVVRVMSYGKNSEGKEVEQGVGTGVVITDKGIILTNLHVVQSAQSVRIVYADGSESPATVTGAQPQNDLAVLQAQIIPDDLIAATMRSTNDLVPGEDVVAVGFPFGIGPSVSSGVISGFDRAFKSPEGVQEIGNLIQFDAAANPGNSGGPLVTMDGEVIGIVTGILNPTSHRTFVGIGFAVPIESAASAAGLPPF